MLADRVMIRTTLVVDDGALVYLALDDAGLLAQCDVDTHRVRGPGGQHRNKTESAVRLRHRPTGLIVTATERRSQHQNRANAVSRLRAAVALYVRRPAGFTLGTEPSAALASCRTAEGRLRVGRRDERFWPVVAEVLDILCAHGTRVSEAAADLGISTGNLVALLQSDDGLWKRVNELRAAAGERPLR